MDTFILANSSVIKSRNDLEAWKESFRLQAIDPPGLKAGQSVCDEPEQMQIATMVKPIEAIKKGIDELLRVPREPLMNACL
jgi:hypothetical protein